jgi:hypothetical protein
LRLGIYLLAAGVALSPAPALAQATQPATTNTPATDAVGPRDLQNFSLQGTVTRPAEQAAPPAAEAPPAPRKVTQTAPPAPTEPRRTAGAPVPSAKAQRTETAPVQSSALAERGPEPIRQTPPASSVTVALPALDNDAGRGSAVAVVPASDPSPGVLAPERKLALWPRLLAALALGVGGAFLLWRNRSREAFAGGPRFDAFVAPEPEPAPAPAPEPEPVAITR